MSRSGLLLAAALALAACSAEKKKAASRGELVSVTGVVARVEENGFQVRTDDGQVLSLALRSTAAVTLAGGEAQSAVITEGAPVRVSYRPKGSGGEAVSVDVEPQATTGTGELKPREADVDPPANPEQAARGR